jgi:hypothetical protein
MASLFLCFFVSFFVGLQLDAHHYLMSFKHSNLGKTTGTNGREAKANNQTNKQTK